MKKSQKDPNRDSTKNNNNRGSLKEKISQSYKEITNKFPKEVVDLPEVTDQEITAAREATLKKIIKDPADWEIVKKGGKLDIIDPTDTEENIKLTKKEWQEIEETHKQTKLIIQYPKAPPLINKKQESSSKNVESSNTNYDTLPTTEKKPIPKEISAAYRGLPSMEDDGTLSQPSIPNVSDDYRGLPPSIQDDETIQPPSFGSKP